MSALCVLECVLKFLKIFVLNFFSCAPASKLCELFYHCFGRGLLLKSTSCHACSLLLQLPVTVLIAVPYTVGCTAVSSFHILSCAEHCVGILVYSGNFSENMWAVLVQNMRNLAKYALKYAAYMRHICCIYVALRKYVA